jgi:centrosomal protein CEP78
MSLSAPKKLIERKSTSGIQKNAKRDIKALAYDHCKKLYQKYYSNPNIHLINQLKKKELSLNMSNLSIKDVSILNELLSKYTYFEQIEIFSSKHFKNDSKYKSNKYSKENLEFNDKLKNISNKIIIGLSKNLSISKSLISLSLSCFEFDQKSSQIFSKGIMSNKFLKGLKISESNIHLDSYELLIKGLYNHDSITYLDLSNNNLGDKFGNIIARLIAQQAQKRDQIVWSCGLRNEKVMNKDYSKGLRSINLSRNKLGKYSAEALANALGNEKYIRAIYLNNNRMDNGACKKLIYMMRKNLYILTLDLRNNPGYDEYIHSRLVMKMSKNIHYLYQQHKKGECTGEEFENLKEFIDATFFDVDIPEEIVEFYNKNIPGENSDGSEMEGEGEQEEKNDKNDKKEGEKVLKNNYIDKENEYNDEKEDIILKNKKLVEENLRLKQEIIELKAKNVQKHIRETNKSKETSESENYNYYQRVEELISELNEIMDKIEKNKAMKKESKNKNNNNNNNIDVVNETKKNKNAEKLDLNIISNNNKKDINIIENKTDDSEKKLKNNKKETKNEKIQKNEKNEKKNEDKIIIKKEEEKNNEGKENKSNKENKLEPIPYEGVQVEQTEERNKDNSENNSHYMDEEGNIYNYDDLSDEEKMVIVQQQLILQKLQEEAEARGEQFDPQEYIEFLERQALEEEEEEEQKEGKKSNKLNKSF